MVSGAVENEHSCGVELGTEVAHSPFQVIVFSADPHEREPIFIYSELD